MIINDAHYAVRHALRRGELVRADVCERCGKTAAQNKRALSGHHHNGYDEDHWLDVQWLCTSCHTEIHAAPAANAMRTPESRSAAARKRSARMTREERSALGRRAGAISMANRTPEERSALAKKAASVGARAGGLAGGHAGGLARARKLSPERIREISSKAGLAAQVAAVRGSNGRFIRKT